MKKNLPILILASAFIGFVTYATVKTQQTENEKLAETTNVIEETTESLTAELMNSEDKAADNFILVKENPTKNNPEVVTLPVTPTKTPLPIIIETPQIIEETPPPYIPLKEDEDEDERDDD